jgi:alginate O-acetyltransferase complex protein AlgI
VYRHVRRSPGVATCLGFAFSAVLHEAALSLPVQAGYGLPTAYFCLHGVLVLVERRLGIRSRAWTAACVVLPVPLVFHPWFLRGAVWPIAGL